MSDEMDQRLNRIELQIGLPCFSELQWHHATGFPQDAQDPAGMLVPFDEFDVLAWAVRFNWLTREQALEITERIQGSVPAAVDASDGFDLDDLLAASVESPAVQQSVFQSLLPSDARPAIDWVTIRIPVVRDTKTKLGPQRNQNFSLTSADADVRHAFGQIYDGLRYSFTELRGGAAAGRWADVYRFLGQQVAKAISEQVKK